MTITHGERITPHLYRVAWWDMAGPDAINCDAFAIDCGDAVVLIDAGRGGLSYALLKENLAYWGLWERVKVCLLTHCHADHIGGAVELQAGGIPVWGGEGAAAYLADERARADLGEAIPRLDRILKDGEKFGFGNTAFEMLATPGHTSACVTYLATIDGLRAAFTGDLLMPHGTIGYSGSPDFDARRLLNSLERLSSRDFDAVLTGHMLRSSQPEGFWLRDGKVHLLETLRAGREGKWMI